MTEKTTSAPESLDHAEVGEGATWRILSDCWAGTIIKKTAKTITWQRDKSTLLNGANSDAEDKLTVSVGGFCAHTSGRQRYSYQPDTDGSIVKFSRRDYGKRVVWLKTGHRSRSPGNTLTLGRHEHFDFNF